MQKEVAERSKKELNESGIFKKPVITKIMEFTTFYPAEEDYQNYYKNMLKSSKVKEYNFHVLRHTFATNCIEVGMDIKSLSEILGHATVDITLNRYVHSSRKMKEKYLEKL